MTEQLSPVSSVGSRGPNHRDLYLLAAGLLLGILLSPAVLGRLAPQVWDRLFLDPVTAQQALTEFEMELEQTRQRLLGTGVSEPALVEFDARFDQQRQDLQQRLQRAWYNHGRLASLMIALALVLVIEAVVYPARPAAAGRLVTVRYALAAMWIALLLAHPSMARGVDVLFVGLLLLVAVVVGLLPMPRRHSPSPANNPNEPPA